MMELPVTMHTYKFTHNMTLFPLISASPEKHNFYHTECIWKRDQEPDAF